MKLIQLIGCALIVFSGQAFSLERADVRKYLEDPNFECSWENGKPTSVDVASDKVCLGNVSCKYLPKNGAPATKLAKADYKFMTGCKANDDGSCLEAKPCEYRNDTSTPEVGTLVGYLTSKEEKTQKDADLGECSYDTVENYARGALLQRKDDASIFCASPLKCTGGTVQPKIPLAICDPDDYKILKEKNPKTNEMQDVYYPVCPPPLTCFKKSEKDGYKFEMATVTKKEANNATVSSKKTVPHAKSKLLEQFADITSRPTPGKLPELPHI